MTIFTKHSLIIILVLIVHSSCCWEKPGVAQDSPQADNVVLITLDGLRWQELFTGADQRLMSKDTGDVAEPDKLRKEFWSDSARIRRELLMPFFWRTIVKQGQIIGDPDANSKVEVTNGRYFSYPGYNEILCGFGDKAIDSNDKNYNQNVTVLEWLNRKPRFRGQVAAFCSWDVFPFIINDKRSGIPVNAGWQKLAVASDASSLRMANRIGLDLPRYWSSVRYDALTHWGAVEYLKNKKPRVLYLALGETDDWAHAGRYDLYLESARTSDKLICHLWEHLQQDPFYRGRTTMLLTTDHGRGDGREAWKSHNNEIPGSEFIWIAAMGPGVKPLGVRRNVIATQSQVAATVSDLLGFDFRTFNSRIAKPLTFDEEVHKESK